mgnify:CR=1 FL=1
MEPNKAAGTADLWYVDNYILLKDYYDRTISRIAARCVRKGNIAIEDLSLIHISEPTRPY